MNALKGVPSMPRQHEDIAVPILMYHSISDEAIRQFRQFAVSPAQFAEHMDYLYQQAYTPISVTRLACALFTGETGRASLPANPVAITFDDGFADFYDTALPILKRYSFTATLYITTAFVNGTSSWLQHEGESRRPMVSWEQITEISAREIEIGAHSHRHLQLDTLPLAKAREEIMLSKYLLEEHLDTHVRSFAYPFGYSTSKVRQFVKNAGFTSACAVKHALSSEASDPFALERVMVDAATTVDTLATLLHTGHCASPLVTVYQRMRTPIWQFARRSSAAIMHRL